MSQELEGTLTNTANLVGSFGSTGSGSNNYNDLANKPSINSVELVGNKTGNQLGLVSDTDLATVATTGNYNDLLHKPTIPAAQVNSDWNAISGVARILNKPTIPTKTSDLTNDSGFVESSDLATVATTGDYDDLTNKPTIPAAQVNSDWNSTSGVSEILNKPTLSTVATSGSYNDLTDTPTIPINSDFDLSGLGDVSVSGASTGQVLTKGVSGWEASSLNITQVWSGAKHSQGDYVTLTQFDEHKMYVLTFKAFSSAGWLCNFIIYGGNEYHQISFWGDNTQFARYRLQLDKTHGEFYMSDVTNGSATNELVAVYQIN